MNTEPMNETDIWIYRARPIRAVDGDTVYVTVDHGMSIHSIQSLRVADVDAPEIYGGTAESKVLGQGAKAFVEEWLRDETGSAWPLLIRTRKDTRSFNRYVADIYAIDTEEFLGAALLASGHAVPAER